MGERLMVAAVGGGKSPASYSNEVEPRSGPSQNPAPLGSFTKKAQKTQKKTKKNSRKAAKTQRGPRMRANRRELKKIHAKGGRGVAQAKKTQNLHRRSQRSRSTGEKTFSLLTFPVPVCVSGRRLQAAPRSPASGPRGGGGHRGRGE